MPLKRAAPTHPDLDHAGSDGNMLHTEADGLVVLPTRALDKDAVPSGYLVKFYLTKH